MPTAPPPRRPPRNLPRGRRGPPFRRVHVGRLGLTGARVDALVRPDGGVELIFDAPPARHSTR